MKFNPKARLDPSQVRRLGPSAEQAEGDDRFALGQSRFGNLDDVFGAVAQAIGSSAGMGSGGGGSGGMLQVAQRRLSSRPGPQAAAPKMVGGPGPAPAASPVAHANGDVRQMVQQAAQARGWSGAQWNALADLIQRESSWNPNAANPKSSAAGLFQFLDSTRKNYGITRTSPLQQQIDAGLRYIADRYKTPQGALSHWLSRKPINGRDVGHWY